MAKQKKDLGLVVWVFGWLLALVTAIKKISSKLNVPFVAFERLGSPEGEATLEKIVQLINDDYWLAVGRSKTAEHGGTPYRGGVAASCEVRETITVPDLSGSALIAEARKRLDLTHLDSDYAKYDFVRGENGKTYEVMTWKPGREVVPGTEVRAYFAERGFCGNAAAFVAWVTENNPEGYHATIPEDDRLCHDANGNLYAPYFLRDDGDRELDLYYDVRSTWFGDWVFVAFREVIQ